MSQTHNDTQTYTNNYSPTLNVTKNEKMTYIMLHTDTHIHNNDDTQDTYHSKFTQNQNWRGILCKIKMGFILFYVYIRIYIHIYLCIYECIYICVYIDLNKGIKTLTNTYNRSHSVIFTEKKPKNSYLIYAYQILFQLLSHNDTHKHTPRDIHIMTETITHRMTIRHFMFLCLFVNFVC